MRDLRPSLLHNEKIKIILLNGDPIEYFQAPRLDLTSDSVVFERQIIAINDLSRHQRDGRKEKIEE